MQSTTSLHTASLPRALQAMLSAMEHGIDNIDQTSYPPHNIFRTGENDFYIEMTVSGFTPEEIEISVERNTLEISGTKGADEKNEEGDERIFLHRGLAQRDFKRSYKIGEYIVVQGADIKNGILMIHLTREIPEEARPRKVDIRVG
jgi:molecular chaperone IbpA